tara:strand:- start:815 stop:1144 length:330 start_codon:yes stop_codon:yes gene_type:complete
MTNVVDATHIFQLNQKSPVEGFKNYGAYEDTLKYSEELSMDVINLCVDYLEYNNIDTDMDKLVDDFSFINIFVNAAIDRQLGLENPVLTEMDEVIEEWKKESEEVEGVI